MSHKKINIEDAKIKTATITINAVSVSKKQMTLAVFRQIQVENIIDENTYQLRGLPWGLVNYYGKNDLENLDDGYYGAFGGKPIHVLWQKKDEFRRCVLKHLKNAQESDYNMLLHNPLQSHGRWPFDHLDYLNIYKTKNFIDVVNEKYRWLIQDFHGPFAPPEIPHLTLGEYGRAETTKENNLKMDIFRKEWIEIIHQIGKTEYQKYIDTILNPYNNLIDQLEQLEQLFIAV